MATARRCASRAPALAAGPASTRAKSRSLAQRSAAISTSSRVSK
jgi:hypothetical protein